MHSWGYWLKISPLWIWPMKTVAGPQSGSAGSASRAASAPSRATSSAPAAMTLGSCRGRITSWTGGPSRRIVTFQVADPLPTTGRMSWSGSGMQDRVADVALGDQPVELLAVAPGGLVQVVRGQQDRPAGQGVGVAEDAQRLDGGRDPALHVRRPAAGTPPSRGGTNLDVEVAVELAACGRVEVAVDGGAAITRLGRSTGPSSDHRTVGDGPGLPVRLGT